MATPTASRAAVVSIDVLPIDNDDVAAVRPIVANFCATVISSVDVTMASGIVTRDDDFTAAAVVRVSPIDAKAPDADNVRVVMSATGAVALSLLRAATSAASAMTAKGLPFGSCA